MADIPGNSTTTTSMNVGDELFNKIDTAGDSDWIAITLEAGQSYSFNLVSAASNGSGSYNPLLSLYDSAGSLITSNDDVGKGLVVNPLIGNANFSTGSYINFTASTSGTYYLAASGSGSSTGNYMLSAYKEDIQSDTMTPATLEVGGSVTGQVTGVSGSYDDDYYAVKTVVGQYYTITLSGSGDHPLSSTYLAALTSSGDVIRDVGDWGFGVAQVTFKALETTTYIDVSNNVTSASGQYTLQINDGKPLDTLTWNITSPNDIKVFFVGNSNVTTADGDSFTALAWTSSEITAAMKAYSKYTDIADVHFTQVSSAADANFFMIKGPSGEFSTGELGHWNVNGGATVVDGVTYNIDGSGVFNATTSEWGNQQEGGDGFLTLVHEIGHGMGLAHPFDNGGGSAALPGVIDPFGQLGDYSLNQSVYSIMAYNRSYAEEFGVNSAIDYGGAAGPMALDIAAIQQMYGANTDHNSGTNTYVLPTANAVGTYFQSIWDTGGKDTIVQNGSDAAVIDLRPASLKYDSVAGGGISFVTGIRGGFTIANGVVIENASGGSGDDRIIGNSATNTLHGNNGMDVIAGLGGNDKLYGDAGSDMLYGDGLPGIASGIGMGSGLVTKAQGTGNNDFTTALDITNTFDLTSNANIENSTTTPHVTINGTADASTRDFYKLTLAAGVMITVDIDGFFGGSSNSNVRIYGADTASYLSQFNDGSKLDGGGGSTSTFDSFGHFTTVTAGVYYIRVSDWTNGTMSSGTTYTLNVSVVDKTDAITSTSGNDTLDGGAGADTMVGGGGDDIYVVDDSGDKVQESSGGGTDTVRSSISYTLVSQVEKLVLTGTDALDGTGNTLGNEITGNASANILDGGVDTKADTLIGGAGNDTYIIHSANDIVTETAGNGTADMVKSGVSYVLATATDIEFLQTLDASATTAIDLTGNTLKQTIQGNEGANTLKGDGGNDTLIGGGGNDTLDGGTGDDTMKGGKGNDTYIVDSKLDVVSETGGSGVDLVKASVSFVLISGFENLTLTGSSKINATGNTGANTIIGNSGQNVLDGGGGTDTMNGGKGNDTYIVDSMSDVVSETGGDGIDLVKSSASFTLATGLENLTLTGTSKISGTGNSAANIITGNSAHNVLKGGGGADIFVFNTKLVSANYDTISDYNGNDSFHIDNSVFTGLSTGSLASSAFKEISSATSTKGVDSTDRILYDNHHGDLYFDRDGSGTHYDRIKFAHVANDTKLDHTDFLIV